LCKYANQKSTNQKMEPVKDETVELCLSVMGEHHVGKSEIVRRFLKKTKKEYQPTIFDRTSILYRLKHFLIELSLQDIGSRQTNDSMLEEFWSQWIHDTDCFVLVFNLGKKSSFDYILHVITEIKTEKKFSQGNTPTVNPFVPILVVGLLYPDCKRVLESSDVKKVLMKKLNLFENKEVPWYMEFPMTTDGGTEEIFQGSLNQAIKFQGKQEQYTNGKKGTHLRTTSGSGGSRSGLNVFTCLSESAEEEQPPNFRTPK
jgi:GTPase SAR1 family protein